MPADLGADLRTHHAAAEPAAAVHPRDEIIKYLSPLRAFAISLTGSTAAADDLVQDTIVKAWSHICHIPAGDMAVS